MIRGLLVALTLLVGGTAYGQGEPLYTDTERAWDEALDQTVPATNEFVGVGQFLDQLWNDYFGMMEYSQQIETLLEDAGALKDSASEYLDEANQFLDDGYSHVQLRDMAYAEEDFCTAASEDSMAREDFEHAEAAGITARQKCAAADAKLDQADALIQ